jgi:hypothetical protein
MTVSITQTTKSGKTLLLVVATSLENCPLPKLHGKETKVERKLIPRNRVVYHKDHPLYGQPRPDGSKPQDVAERRISLATYGFDYSILPPQVIPDPERQGWYIGLAGWTWDKALDEEKITTFIYDVIYEGAPLDIRKRKSMTNILPASAFRKGSSEKALTAETINAIANKEIDREDEVALWNFILDIGSDKSLQMQKDIFKAVCMDTPKLDDSIYLWHSQGTGDHSFAYAAKTYDIPFAGNKDPNRKTLGQNERLGYICEKGGGHGMWMNAMKWFVKFLGKKRVEFTATSGSLKQGSIDEPRLTWDEDFVNRRIMITDFVQLIAGVRDNTDETSKALCETIEKNMKENFIRSNEGFCHLPQKRAKYAKNGGGARETTMVNKLGELPKK